MAKTTFINCLYPNKCAACDEIIDDGNILCDYCGIVINNNDLSKTCFKCGMPKDNCRCKYREFRFKGIVGAFRNAGAAKTVCYSYKMGKRRELADFLTKRVYCAVKRAFGDIKFDAVCAVPATPGSRLKHGFDHAGIIAENLAQAMGVRYLSGVLRVRPFRRPQHKSVFRQRLENVRGKYYTVKRTDAKRVLLFDDIYTTGATLDEAAKELMFAGVQEVYCAAVLATNVKKKPDGVKNNGN